MRVRLSVVVQCTDNRSLLGSVGQSDGRTASGDSRGRAALDQRRENREKAPRPYTPTVQMVPEGGFVAGPLRSGGPFDPLGVRACDVTNADRVVKMIDHLHGRWVTTCVTIDRKMWTSPEAAYQRVQDRVREICRVISLLGIHVTAMELQGKTGDGWPHWHILIYCPDARTIEEIREKAVKAWHIRTEHVDHETGEVTVSREKIGTCHVEEARDRSGAARYAAKYLLKPWAAVPAWMGESRRQLRKLRPGGKCYPYWEMLGLHTRRLGSRRSPKTHRKPARKLFDRMARSGLSHAVFRRRGEQLEFVGLIPVPASHDGAKLLGAAGARVVQAGPWAKTRWALDESSMSQLRASWDELLELQRSEYVKRRRDLACAWEREQAERAARESGDV